ncbi:hypothetical protein DMZ43_03485 [Meridianimaribacter sp. CL38]|uniref:hypothetical protein n=1 Tax=Meridianimaribacter sp. CL38 TaxID=2213021 RepID=UPI00103917C3|nr:hypothetical protein [Meridianimaribacter sp. CL38]TBV28116.1 hypothetical protein DMZ43_03485 [Meridianimaribacter sp. CL38]
MKIRIVIVFLIFASCSPKITREANSVKSFEDLKEEIIAFKNYEKEVKNNKNLKQEITEGALTDTLGFKDVGRFKHSVFYNEKTNELFRIKNIEITDKTLVENYYFKNGEFYFVLVGETEASYPQYLYFTTKGSTVEHAREFARLSKKAEIFKRDFEKTH